jgi:hypothetical protein
MKIWKHTSVDYRNTEPSQRIPWELISIGSFEKTAIQNQTEVGWSSG